MERSAQEYKHEEMGQFQTVKRMATQVAEGRALKPGVSAGAEKPTPYRRPGRKIGRNEPCPCGSGKKYKKCCYPKYG